MDETVTGGKNTFFNNLTFFNSTNANFLFWEKNRREIFWDTDGSLTNVTGGAYVVPYKIHLDGINGCTVNNTAQWNSSIICAMN